jgi:hypothetical protein
MRQWPSGSEDLVENVTAGTPDQRVRIISGRQDRKPQTSARPQQRQRPPQRARRGALTRGIAIEAQDRLRSEAP